MAVFVCCKACVRVNHIHRDDVMLRKRALWLYKVKERAPTPCSSVLLRLKALLEGVNGPTSTLVS